MDGQKNRQSGLSGLSHRLTGFHDGHWLMLSRLEDVVLREDSCIALREPVPLITSVSRVLFKHNGKHKAKQLVELLHPISQARQISLILCPIAHSKSALIFARFVQLVIVPYARWFYLPLIDIIYHSYFHAL